MFHFTVSGIIMPRQGCNEKKIYKDKHIFLDETVNKTSRTSIRPNDGPPPLLHGLSQGLQAFACQRSRHPSLSPRSGHVVRRNLQSCRSPYITRDNQNKHNKAYIHFP